MTRYGKKYVKKKNGHLFQLYNKYYLYLIMNIDNIKIQNRLRIPSFQSRKDTFNGNLFHIKEDDTFYIQTIDGEFQSLNVVPFGSDLSGSSLCQYRADIQTVFYEPERDVSLNISIGGSLSKSMNNTILGKNSVDFHQSDDQHTTFGENGVLFIGTQNLIDPYSTYSTIFNGENQQIYANQFGQILNGTNNILFGITKINDDIYVDFSGNEYIPVNDGFRCNGEFRENMYNLILNGNDNHIINNLCVNYDVFEDSTISEAFEIKYNTIFNGTQNKIGFGAFYTNLFCSTDSRIGNLEVNGSNINNTLPAQCNNLFITENIKCSGLCNNIFNSITTELLILTYTYLNLYTNDFVIETNELGGQFINLCINTNTDTLLKGRCNNAYINKINIESTSKTSFNVSYINNVVNNTSYNVMGINNRIERFIEDEYRGANFTGMNAQLINDCSYCNSFYNTLSIIDNSSFCGTFIVENTRIESSNYSNIYISNNSNILNSRFSSIYNADNSQHRSTYYSDTYNGINHQIQNSYMCDIFNGENNTILDSSNCTILNGANCQMINIENSSILSGINVEMDRNDEIYNHNLDIYGSIIYRNTKFIDGFSSISGSLIIDTEDYEYIIKAGTGGGEIRLPDSSQSFDGMEIVLQLYDISSSSPVFIDSSIDTLIQTPIGPRNQIVAVQGQTNYYKFIYYQGAWYLFE